MDTEAQAAQSLCAVSHRLGPQSHREPHFLSCIEGKRLPGDTYTLVMSERRAKKSDIEQGHIVKGIEGRQPGGDVSGVNA